jgi:hypothetical protein
VRPSPALFRDSVSVEAYTGDGAYGPVYAAAATVLCKLSYVRQLVRDANGDEAVSEATLYVRPADSAAFVPESRLTIGAYTTTVLGVSPQGRPGETDLVKVTCR